MQSTNQSTAYSQHSFKAIKHFGKGQLLDLLLTFKETHLSKQQEITSFFGDKRQRNVASLFHAFPTIHLFWEQKIQQTEQIYEPSVGN